MQSVLCKGIARRAISRPVAWTHRSDAWVNQSIVLCNRQWVRPFYHKTKFRDRIILDVKAGSGGDGCISFFSLGPVKKRPNGGHGGNGGDVFFEASTSCRSFAACRGLQRAKDGTKGANNGQHGRNAKDLKIRVPVGTVISEMITSWGIDEDGNRVRLDRETVLRDMDEDGTRLIVAKGGQGGKGNVIQVSKSDDFYIRMTPEDAKGEAGEQRRLRLTLKTIADVGLVGYPNAGKSTFLRAISRATPKVASYPFTTLHPNIGTLEFTDFEKVTVADIPGLVDGAHDNRGLGHYFLRHIERTKVLIFMVDVLANQTEDRENSPADDLRSLCEELELYQKGLSQKPSIVIANKMDKLDAKDREAQIKEMEAVMPENCVGLWKASALHGGGVRDVVYAIREIVDKQREDEKLSKLQSEEHSNDDDIDEFDV